MSANDVLQEILWQDAEDIPFYERAAIRSRDLVSLRMRLRQAEGERDALERAFTALLAGLGFVAADFCSESGAREAVARLLEIARGKYQREDCGIVAADTVIAALFDVLERERNRE